MVCGEATADVDGFRDEVGDTDGFEDCADDLDDLDDIEDGVDLVDVLPGRVLDEPVIDPWTVM